MQYQGRLQEEQTRARRWIAVVDERVTPEQVMTGAYWARMAWDLQPGDTIRVDAVDMEWTLTLRVMGANGADGRVVVAVETPLRRFEAPPVPEGFKIHWHGAYGWRIMRDGNVVHESFASLMDAVTWLRQHLGMSAAPPNRALRYTPSNGTYRIVDADTGEAVEKGFATEADARARLEALAE